MSRAGVGNVFMIISFEKYLLKYFKLMKILSSSFESFSGGEPLNLPFMSDTGREANLPTPDLDYHFFICFVAYFLDWAVEKVVKVSQHQWETPIVPVFCFTSKSMRCEKD